MEIPVTTIPIVKLPFHFSYLLYLARHSERLMMSYLQVAMAACRVTRTEPSFLLHPLDIIGSDQVSELAFVPGMEIPSARKTELFVRALSAMQQHFDFMPMGEYARKVEGRGPIPARAAA
jgi:peptidoglycan-N-acetylglucosamine deacetylase